VAVTTEELDVPSAGRAIPTPVMGLDDASLSAHGAEEWTDEDVIGGRGKVHLGKEPPQAHSDAVVCILSRPDLLRVISMIGWPAGVVAVLLAGFSLTGFAAILKPVRRLSVSPEFCSWMVLLASLAPLFFHFLPLL